MCGSLKEAAGEDLHNLREYMHRAWLCKKVFMLYPPSKHNRMEKAKQTNEAHHRALQAQTPGQKGRKQACSTMSLPEETPPGICGVGSEKSSRCTTPVMADTNRELSELRSSNPGMSPLLSWGWSSKPCPCTRVVLVAANWSSAPTHRVQATPTNGVCQPPKKLRAPEQQPHALPLPIGCFQQQPHDLPLPIGCFLHPVLQMTLLSPELHR